MSKRERLEKQKKKQDELKRLEELNEVKECENAGNIMSKSAQKMLKKAKKEKKPNVEGGLFLFAKIVMVILFLFSGLYYGGVTVVGILKGYMEEIPHWVAGAMGIGAAVVALGIVLSFIKKYYASLLIILGGTISYMKAASYIISKISDKLQNYDGADADIAKLDKSYMIHYYPILGILIIAFVLALVKFIKLIKKRKKLKEQRDNAPVKSIINS